MTEATEPGGMVKFQFQIDDDTWEDWKSTVPRSKSLESRIIELIEADRDGRVRDREAAAEPEQPDVRGGGETVETTTPDTAERPTVDRARLVEEVPGSGELAERRADEIVKMYDYLREHGTAEKDDLLGAVDVEATDYAGAESVWSNMVKGKSTLKSLPGVISPPAGKSEWKYREENDE